MDIHGYIYSSIFNPFAPSTNLLADDDESCGDGQFWLQSILHANTTYIFVVSTDIPSVIGTVSIVSKGAGYLSFTRLGEYRRCSLEASHGHYTPDVLFRLEPPPPAYSTYASQLNTSSETFSRDHCATLTYYYEAIRINVAIDGYYIFCSNSSIDTYGYIYLNTFDPFDLSSDLLASDDNGCDNQQFRLCVYLETSTLYVLLVTTNDAGVTGAFSVRVVRGAEVSFTRMGRIGEYA